MTLKGTTFDPNSSSWERLKAEGTALKEWSAMDQALLEGKQAVLLRKGGIHEKGFDVSDPCFYIFPTYLHQEADKFRPEFKELGAHSQAGNPGNETLILSAAAEVVDSVSTTSREPLSELAKLTVMTEEALDIRYNWKPEQALHILLVRVRPLVVAQTLPMLPRYGGCRSWIKVGPLPSVEWKDPVLDDSALEKIQQDIRSILHK